MRGEQNTASVGCPGEDRLGDEGNQGARSMTSVEEGTVDQCVYLEGLNVFKSEAWSLEPPYAERHVLCGVVGAGRTRPYPIWASKGPLG
jgi:hypothetical protein